uniref:Maturase K n=1 Tax=Panagrolaimus sp. PS1159 TaxID=55785 RepID=A0AC35FVQ7_9BILA
MVFPNRSQFYSTYRHQVFAFQDSIMHYLAKYPKSAKLYQKLVQSCKYFFLMNPILILSELRYTNAGWEAMTEDGWKRLDINNILSKCWITEGLYGYTWHNNHLVSSLIPNIYKCDAKRFYLHN